MQRGQAVGIYVIDRSTDIPTKEKKEKKKEK